MGFVSAGRGLGSTFFLELPVFSAAKAGLRKDSREVVPLVQKPLNKPSTRRYLTSNVRVNVINDESQRDEVVMDQRTDLRASMTVTGWVHSDLVHNDSKRDLTPVDMNINMDTVEMLTGGEIDSFLQRGEKFS